MTTDVHIMIFEGCAPHVYSALVPKIVAPRQPSTALARFLAIWPRLGVGIWLEHAVLIVKVQHGRTLPTDL
jgi:hypothetical protein